MESLRNTAVVLAIPLALLGLPGAVAAESVVPPENSAATQYTEAIPTGGGQKDAGKTGKRTPAAVLGSHKAQKLSAKGPQGQAAAEAAAATAPSPEPVPASAPQEAADSEMPSPSDPSQPGRGKSPTGKAKADARSNDAASHRVASHRATLALAIPAGSSGFGEVLAQATGSSSNGELSFMLPLLIIAALAWSLIFFWRQRRLGA